jgi:hypothetical protein
MIDLIDEVPPLPTVCANAIDVAQVVCQARLMWIAEKGAGYLMAPSDMMLVVWSMQPSAAEPFDPHWRVNASLAGCRHEPETKRLDRIGRRA